MSYVPSQLCKDCWAAHECFRRLGYSANVIFITKSEKGELLVVLKPADTMFSLIVGMLSESIEDFSRGDWNEFCEVLRGSALSEEQLHEWLQTFLGRIGGGALLIMKMIEKGFSPVRGSDLN